jgi:secondary thiamine-phosphate synthase enzyme
MTVKTLSIATDRPQQMVDITREIRQALKDSGTGSGICRVFVPHTTAGITINENADPNVRQDILDTLDRMAPIRGNYLHDEGNSHAHVKATLVGSSVSVFVETGQLMLGTWQSIFLCEFDGPRTRNVLVRVTPG